MNDIALANTGLELQDMLDVMQDYVVKWVMMFNGKQSKVMVVGKGLKWNIEGDELEVTEGFRYLGVKVDEKLRGNVHLEEFKVRQKNGLERYFRLAK